MLPRDTGQVAQVPPMTSLEAQGLRPKGGDRGKIWVALESHTGLSQEQGDLGAPGHGTKDWPLRGNHPSSHRLGIPALKGLSSLLSRSFRKHRFSKGRSKCSEYFNHLTAG